LEAVARSIPLTSSTLYRWPTNFLTAPASFILLLFPAPSKKHSSHIINTASVAHKLLDGSSFVHSTPISSSKQTDAEYILFYVPCLSLRMNREFSLHFLCKFYRAVNAFKCLLPRYPFNAWWTSKASGNTQFHLTLSVDGDCTQKSCRVHTILCPLSESQDEPRILPTLSVQVLPCSKRFQVSSSSLSFQCLMDLKSFWKYTVSPYS
jgi:hypothetical protein